MGGELANPSGRSWQDMHDMIWDGHAPQSHSILLFFSSFPLVVARTVRGCVCGGTEQERLKRGFMSAEFVLVVIGALLQLWRICFSVFYVHCMLLLCLQQRTNLVFPSISMRLRPRRTCSGVKCFGGFHIKRFFYRFLFLREALT
ncbi:hypothetical protein AAG906_031569 [Vitis piasezkii]